jgi:hypothetical protein
MFVTRRTLIVSGACVAIAAAALFGWRMQWTREPAVADGGDHRETARPAASERNAAEPPAISPAPKIATATVDLNSVFPPPELPEVVTERVARVSLGYLAENGADLSKPIPSKHRVFAANENVAAQVVAWAKANGFQVRGPEMIRDHTGKPQQRLDLVRTEVLTPEQIEREGRLVLAAVQHIPGTYYQTWSGEIIR